MVYRCKKCNDILKVASANRCYFKNELFVRFWKDGLLAKLNARMSWGRRYLLFLKHMCLVTLNGKIIMLMFHVYDICCGEILLFRVQNRIRWKKKVEPKRLQGGSIFMSTGWPPFRYCVSTTLQSGTVYPKWLQGGAILAPLFSVYMSKITWKQDLGVSRWRSTSCATIGPGQVLGSATGTHSFFALLICWRRCKIGFYMFQHGGHAKKVIN